MSRTDAELQRAILQELETDSHVAQTEVGVEVDAGVVTLTGTVDSWRKRFAAQQAAHRVPGVLDVANDLVVKLPSTPGRTDTQLAQAVRHALEHNALVPGARVHTTVSDGFVTLEGNVETWQQREDAERAVRSLHGVCGVVNNLEIDAVVLAGDVQAAIDAALARAKRDGGAPCNVTVEAREGRVVLSGTVSSLLEKELVLDAVRETEGVSSIHDWLRIEAGF